MPFSGPNGVGDARVKLEQVSPKRFELIEGFHYVSEATGAEFEVTPQSLGQTDLASVPFLLRWFVNSYGRHTLAALLHDCLVVGSCAQTVTVGGAAPPSREEADDLFLEALEDREVPLIRRYLMWAAVTYNTRIAKSGGVSRLLMALWTLAALGGAVLLFGGALLWESWVLSALGALGPIPFCVLWGSKWKAGLGFGYGAALLVPAGVVVLASFLPYQWLERLLSSRGQGSPPPSLRDF